MGGDDDQKRRESSRLKKKYQEGNINYEEKSMIDNSLDEHEEELNAIQIENEYSAALQADLNPDDMKEIERKEMKEFIPYKEVYLQVRNLILFLWQKNLNKYLTLSAMKGKIQECFQPFVEPIFRFLKRFGFINTGIIAQPDPNLKEKKTKIIILGAGMAGLAAARQLVSFGYQTMILEGRDRVGGRVNTDWSTFGTGVDCGASIMTGTEGNPLTNVCSQLEHRISLYSLAVDCPIYDEKEVVDSEIDEKIYQIFNTALQHSKKLVNQTSSLGKSLNVLKQKAELNPFEQKLFEWHRGNLEYACASDLDHLDLAQWDQDDPYEWSGDHNMFKNGFGSLPKYLSEDLNILFNKTVTKIEYKYPKCRITTESGEVFEADKVLCTFSLGILKHGDIEFNPPLPESKKKAMEGLELGLLNKCIVQFDEPFWDDSLDQFGHICDDPDNRGEGYMFWNLSKCTGKPVLIALLAGKSAHRAESVPKEETLGRVMKSLRKIFGPSVPDPINYIVTNWKSDKFARGTYSYIKIGGSGKDHQLLSEPVGNTLFFAGEATTHEHPATASGAYLTGLRTAGLIDKSIEGEIFVNSKLVTSFLQKTASSKFMQKRKWYQTERGKRSESYPKSKVSKYNRLKRFKANNDYQWLFEDKSFKVPKLESQKESSPIFPEYNNSPSLFNTISSNLDSPSPQTRFVTSKADLLKGWQPAPKPQQNNNNNSYHNNSNSPFLQQSPHNNNNHQNKNLNNNNNNNDSFSAIERRINQKFKNNSNNTNNNNNFNQNSAFDKSNFPIDLKVLQKIPTQLPLNLQNPPQNTISQISPEQTIHHKSKTHYSSSSSSEKRKPLPTDPAQLKEKISKMVNKYLKERSNQISTKDDFKHLARKFSHIAVEEQKKVNGKYDSGQMKKLTKKIVDSFFDKLPPKTIYHHK